MVMSLFKDSIIVNVQQYLVWLDVLGDTFLGLYELIKCLKLLGHMIDSIIDDFFYLDEVMGVAEAPSHLWILESVFLQAIIAQRKLMGATVLTDLLIVGCANSKRNTLRHHIHLLIRS